MIGVKFEVHTELEARTVTGKDSMIIAAPKELFGRDADGKPLLALGMVSSFLRKASLDGSGRLGELLHHAEWVLTDDPEVVRSVGLSHGCPTCVAGTDQALAYLKANPGRELLAGMLYWASPSE